jgi:hypothetical protein
MFKNSFLCPPLVAKGNYLESCAAVHQWWTTGTIYKSGSVVHQWWTNKWWTSGIIVGFTIAIPIIYGIGKLDGPAISAIGMRLWKLSNVRKESSEG